MCPRRGLDMTWAKTVKHVESFCNILAASFEVRLTFWVFRLRDSFALMFSVFIPCSYVGYFYVSLQITTAPNIPPRSENCQILGDDTHTHTHTNTRALKFLSLSPSASLQFTTSGSLYTLSAHSPLHPPTSLHHSPLPLTPRRAEPIEACWADRPGRGSQGAYRDTTRDKPLCWSCCCRCFPASLRTEMTENRQEEARGNLKEFLTKLIPLLEALLADAFFF